MSSIKSLRTLPVLLLALLFALSPAMLVAQDEPSQKESKKEKKEERREAAAQATPVLWREPTDIATRDLFKGPGGDEMAPDLTKVTFENAETGGYSVKWDVRDGAGKKWTAKLGSEAQTDTVALRLVWAAGYLTEVSYLVPCAHIAGAPKPPGNRGIERCEGDGFVNVRFKSKPEGTKNLDTWSWKDNPFHGTKELQGLIVLMGLLNNWDLKQDNNKILLAKGADGQDELWYVVSDLGATFGKTGGAITRSRNKPEDYVKSGFIQKVDGDRVKFQYHGKQSDLFDNITVTQAKWLGDLLSQLSKQQIDDAFRAGNYKPEEIDALSYELRARINELHSLHAPGEAAGQGN
ncbi:MAG TPA: hypothetical protein VFA21_06555 [Pyrinomonadaceae bacterium]|nr:hypothetical protein [Pyrinomonadaceae bacterium]